MSTGERRTPILAAGLGLMSAARWLTLQCYLRFLFPALWERGDLPVTTRVDASTAYRHAVAMDVYYLCWMALEVVILLVAAHRPTAMFLGIAQVLAVSRIVELVRTGLNTSLFDQVTGRDDYSLASAPRLVLISLLAYLELTACFAIIYASHRELLIQANHSASTVADAIFFAALTQMTISFGVQHPTGWLRAVATVQAFVGLLLVALIIARMMSSLRPLKSLDRE